MNQLPENSLCIYDVTFSNILFNRITWSHDGYSKKGNWTERHLFITPPINLD